MTRVRYSQIDLTATRIKGTPTKFSHLAVLNLWVSNIPYSHPKSPLQDL